MKRMDFVIFLSIVLTIYGLVNYIFHTWVAGFPEGSTLRKISWFLS